MKWTVLLMSWLLASCGGFNGVNNSDTQLFQSVQSDRAMPGCQASDYSFAKDARCFTLSSEDLRSVLFINVRNPKARIRLFPIGVAGGELSIRKELATPSKMNSPGFAFSWVGSVFLDAMSQEKIGTALLSVRGGRVVGRITTRTEVFEIRPLDGRVHVAIKVDQRKKLPMHPPGSLNSEREGNSRERVSRVGLLVNSARENIDRTATVTNVAETLGRTITATDAARECPQPARSADNRESIPTVTVALAFEESARQSSGDIAVLGEAYIDFTNAALEQSRVGLNVALPVDGIREIRNFVHDSGTLNDIASGSSGSSGEIGILYKWRERIQADLVVIVTNNAGWCGVVKEVKVDQPNLGFALVNPKCAVAELTVAHEIGHLLGGDHNPDVMISQRSDLDARGYILRTLNKQTIMADDDGSIKEPYFSNPTVCWDHNTPVGTVDANNARAMRDHASVVSKFLP